MNIDFDQIYANYMDCRNKEATTALKSFERLEDAKALACYDIMMEQSGYIFLTEDIYQVADVAAGANIAGDFLNLIDALKNPVLQANLIGLKVKDLSFLRDLMILIPASGISRPQTTMVFLRARWMELISAELAKDVEMEKEVDDEVKKPLSASDKAQIESDLKLMLQVVTGEEMMTWQLKEKYYTFLSNKVRYQQDPLSVGHNRLKDNVTEILPKLLNLDALKIKDKNLAYMAYLLYSYFTTGNLNAQRISEIEEKVFKYLESVDSPVPNDEEVSVYLPCLAHGYSVWQSQDCKMILSLIDKLRVNNEGWRVGFHHKVMIDDDIDTDKITWPNHYMTKDHAEVIAFKVAWYLLGVKSHFVSEATLLDYYEELAKRLFVRLKGTDSNFVRDKDNMSLTKIVYRQVKNHAPQKKVDFVDRLIGSVDTLFDLGCIMDFCDITLNKEQKQLLNNRLQKEWGWECRIAVARQHPSEAHMNAVLDWWKETLK